MMQNVLNFEPTTALFVPDNDPLLFYRAIAEIWKFCSFTWWRTPNFEINSCFADKVSDMLNALDYAKIEVREDQFGKQRFVKAIHP